MLYLQQMNIIHYLSVSLFEKKNNQTLRYGEKERESAKCMLCVLDYMLG